MLAYPISTVHPFMESQKVSGTAMKKTEQQRMKTCKTENILIKFLQTIC